MVYARAVLTTRAIIRTAGTPYPCPVSRLIMRISMAISNDANVARRRAVMTRRHTAYILARRSFDPAKPLTRARMEKAHGLYVDACYAYVRELIRSGH